MLISLIDRSLSASTCAKENFPKSKLIHQLISAVFPHTHPDQLKVIVLASAHELHRRECCAQVLTFVLWRGCQFSATTVMCTSIWLMTVTSDSMTVLANPNPK